MLSDSCCSSSSPRETPELLHVTQGPHSPSSIPLPYSVRTSATVPITLCWKYLLTRRLHPLDSKLPGRRGHSLFISPVPGPGQGSDCLTEPSSVSQDKTATPSTLVRYILCTLLVERLACYRDRVCAFYPALSSEPSLRQVVGKCL